MPKTITNDAAIFISEEAFKAGFQAGLEAGGFDDFDLFLNDWWGAWSAFEPSEAAKDLTT